jgi:hypothetical protein
VHHSELVLGLRLSSLGGLKKKARRHGGVARKTLSGEVPVPFGKKVARSCSENRQG